METGKTQQLQETRSDTRSSSHPQTPATRDLKGTCPEMPRHRQRAPVILATASQSPTLTTPPRRWVWAHTDPVPRRDPMVGCDRSKTPVRTPRQARKHARTRRQSRAQAGMHVAGRVSHIDMADRSRTEQHAQATARESPRTNTESPTTDSGA